MNTNRKTAKMNTKILLILLWVFYTVNFMYCDTLSSLEPGVLEMHMTGYTADGTVKITDGFLLGIAIMFEIPFLMIVLSWVLKYRANRWANIIAGTLFVLAQIGSLFLGVPISCIHFLQHGRNCSSLTHCLECMEVAQP